MFGTLLMLLLQVRFREESVETGMNDLWDVAVADLNGDGRPDLLALDWNPARVFWYENPTWKRRTVFDGAPAMPVVLTPLTVDGKVALIVGADYHEPPDPARGGTIWLLRRPDDLEEPWVPTRLDAEPTLHRIHLLDGAPLCSALSGPRASLFALRGPDWKRETIATGLTMLHNTVSVDWDGDGRQEVLAASREGITLFRRVGEKWEGKKIGAGHEGSGSSEVAVGRLPGGGRYVAALEPHHGNELVVYTAPEKPDDLWRRRVLRVRKGGHTLATADLGGGGDALLVGFVAEPLWAVYDPAGWKHQVLDESGLPGEDGLWADLNADGRPDAVIGGGKRVKVYWNTGP